MQRVLFRLPIAPKTSSSQVASGFHRWNLKNTLIGHPDVLEAAVVGVPDEKWDERPLACVVRKDGSVATPNDLRAYLGDKVVKWWLPERWAFIAEVPKTSVGKFDKKVLRKQYADGELDVLAAE